MNKKYYLIATLLITAALSISAFSFAPVSRQSESLSAPTPPDIRQAHLYDLAQGKALATASSIRQAHLYDLAQGKVVGISSSIGLPHTYYLAQGKVVLDSLNIRQAHLYDLTH
jgi:hypothetical protein